MNRDRIAGKLKQLGGKLRQQWGRLTHDEAGVDAGRREQLAGSIQARHGLSKEEAERQLREFLDRNRDWNLSSH
ncbi:MAG: CsbD family protein [Burkholderiales bacterium]|nr:CsbD family protein [Burkholderiales bacterium]